MNGTGWFATEGPLYDGWYWWRCNKDDPWPEVMEIINGVIIDSIPADSYGALWNVIEHTDYSGEWYGPLEIPE